MSSVSSRLPSSAGPPLLTSIRRQVRRHRRLLAAALAGWAAFLTVSQLRPSPPPTHPAVVAAHDLAAGTALAADDLVVGELPDSVNLPDTMSDLATAVGRTLVIPVSSHTPLTSTMIHSPTSLNAQQRISGRKLVAIPVRLGDPATAELLQPGDIVDVWAARSAGETALTTDSGPPLATRVANAVRVITVASPRTTGMINSGTQAGSLVVLAVPDSAVAALAFAAQVEHLTVTVLPRAS
jgi:Flp pilus assembly protein CpaB